MESQQHMRSVDYSTNRRFWSVMIILLSLGCLAFVIGGLTAGNNPYLLVGVAFFIVSLPAYYQNSVKERELFSPLNLLFLNLFVGVLIQTTLIVFDLDLNKTLVLQPELQFDIIVNGMTALGIALVFLLIGYSFSPRSYKNWKGHSDIPQRLAISVWSRGRLLVLFVLFGGISLVSLIYFMISFDVLGDLSRLSVKRRLEDGGSAGLLRFGMRFGQVACMILFAYHLGCKRAGQKSGVLSLVLILFLISSIGPFVSSSRSQLLYFLIGMFVVHHFSTGGWKLKGIRNAVIISLSVVVFMGGLRYIQQRAVTYESFREQVGILGSVAKIASANNFLGVKKTAVLMDVVPSEVPYTYGSTYFLWIISPIPRSVWPDKPVVRIGGLLGSAVYGTRDSNGIPPGFVGEAYLNFGWLGIPLVSLLFGAGIRQFYEKIGKHSYNDCRKMMFYAVLFAPIVFGGLSSDFTGFVTRSAQVLIPLLLALKLVGARN